VGIETYQRIAERLGRRALRGGFAIGREPGNAKAEIIKRLFDLVVEGRFLIKVDTLFTFFGQPRLCVFPTDFSAMEQSGYSSARWLVEVPEVGEAVRQSFFTTTLKYEAWATTSPAG
jgi:hypothetical protein